MHRHLLLSPLFLLLIITFPLRADGLRVGTAVVDISPTVKPFQLRSGKSTYVHDPLHVRAVAFENGQGRAVIAVMDAIGVGREMCDEAKTAAAKVTGWKPEHMLIAGTHTHTAPKGGDTSPGRIAYEKTRREGCAKRSSKPSNHWNRRRSASALPRKPAKCTTAAGISSPAGWTPIHGVSRIRCA